MASEREELRAISVRVPPDVWDILDAARMVNRHRGMQDLLRPVVEDVARQWGQIPEVQEILRKIQEFQAREAGELERLEPRRRKPEARR